MKKVVLLTGALAAGLASASLNANASVPASPNVQELTASEQGVAEANYLAYHSMADHAVTLLVDLKDEYNKKDIDADAKKEIIADIEKRQVSITGFTEVLEKVWHAYEQTKVGDYKTDPAFIAALAKLNEAIDDLDAAVAAGTVYFPKDAQILTDLRARYNHVIEEYGNYRQFVKEGMILLGEFQDNMDDDYKEVDETADVKAAKVAAEQAHELFRNTNEAYHANRWYLDSPTNWKKVEDDHVGEKVCCVDGKSKLEELRDDFDKKQQDFGKLIDSYIDAKAGFETALTEANAAETADLVKPAAEYTQSTDGKQWIKDAQDKVNTLQGEAYQYIHTFNATTPAADWDLSKSGEDGALTKPTYDSKAQELINGVTQAIEDLKAAIAEAAANDKAYTDGNTALGERQNELDAIKNYIAGLEDHTADHKYAHNDVYSALIAAQQTAIDNAKSDLHDAWDTWTDKTVVPVDPKNAVEELANNTDPVDGVAYKALKTAIADLKTAVEENETADRQIEDLVIAIEGLYNDLKTVVATYEDVAIGSYTADGTCEHGTYLGTDAIDTKLDGFQQAEADKYNEFDAQGKGSKAYVEEAKALKAELEKDLNLLWNKIATDQCNEYLAHVTTEVEGKYNAAEGLDDVCNDKATAWDWEDENVGVCECEDADKEANPCGWCDATAKGKLEAIRSAYNDKVEELATAHKGDAAATDYKKDGYAKDLVEAFKAYLASATTAAGEWYTAFETADAAHDAKLAEKYDEVEHLVHQNIHETVAAAKLAWANYTDGDKAAADLWAKALGKISLDTNNDGTVDYEYTVENFDNFVAALDNAQADYMTKAAELRDDHHYTQLVNLQDAVKTLLDNATFQKAVDANRAATAELLAQIQALRSDVNAAKAEAADYQCNETVFDALTQPIQEVEDAVNGAYNTGVAVDKHDTNKATIDDLEKQFGEAKKDIDNARVSHTYAQDALNKIDALLTNGAIAKAAELAGKENFETAPAAGEIRSDVKYFDELATAVEELKNQINTDDSHAEGHKAFVNFNNYLQTIEDLKAEVKKLEDAIKANEKAHEAQVAEFESVKTAYECYDTEDVEEAATAITGVASVHSTLDTAVADLLSEYEDLIQKHYTNGASAVEAAQDAIDEAENAYTEKVAAAKANDEKFVELYNDGTSEKANDLAQNWQEPVYEETNYSDTADTNVADAYQAVVDAIDAYLQKIEQDWENGVAATTDYTALQGAVDAAVAAHTAAVEAAEANDAAFNDQLAALADAQAVELAEVAEVSPEVAADALYAALLAQAEGVEDTRIDGVDATILADLETAWEAEEAAAGANKQAIEDYAEAKAEYNALVANLNALGEQLQSCYDKKDQLAAAKTDVNALEVMTPGLKTLPDGDTQDYAAKAALEEEMQNIEESVADLYTMITEGAQDVADAIVAGDNTAENEVAIAEEVQAIEEAIDALLSNAADAETACEANEAAKEELHNNLTDAIATVGKSGDLEEPAKEAYETSMAGKNYGETLEGYHEAFDEAYYNEGAAEYQAANQEAIKATEDEVNYAYNLALEVGKNLGDVTGYDVEADDFTADGLTVQDSNALVDIILYGRDYNKYGDLDFDGENTATDVERLNNLLWYDSVLKAWAPSQVQFEAEIELNAEGNTIGLALNNNSQARAIQFDITVPEGATLSNILGTDRVEGMRVLNSRIAENTYRVLVLSTAKANTINENEGNIITFNVSGAGEVEVSNVHATDRNVIGHNLSGAAINISNPTAIDELVAEGETSIFGLDGIRKSVMQSGVNIVRTANGAVKKLFNK